uniref:Putative secreted protein n=1 Tax=Anopheles darlingi TaxID=43151 RepID=A0A2M4DH15_ANODA
MMLGAWWSSRLLKPLIICLLGSTSYKEIRISQPQTAPLHTHKKSRRTSIVRLMKDEYVEDLRLPLRSSSFYPSGQLESRKVSYLASSCTISAVQKEKRYYFTVSGYLPYTKLPVSRRGDSSFCIFFHNSHQ